METELYRTRDLTDMTESLLLTLLRACASSSGVSVRQSTDRSQRKILLILIR